MTSTAGAVDVSRPGVLLVTDVYPPDCGGSGWSTHSLAQTLRTHGHQVQVVELDPRAEHDNRREYEGVPVTALAIASSRRGLWARFGSHDYAFVAVREHVAEVLRQDPSLRIVHGQHLHSAPGALAAARAARRGAVVTIRDHWPVCLHGTAWWGGGECAGCSGANLAGCINENYGVPPIAARVLIPWARRRLATRVADISRAHRVVAVSATLRDRILARSDADVAIDVVPNIVDPRRSLAAAESVRGGADPTEGLPERYLFTAGKLNAAKGFEGLIEALASATAPLPLVVAGQGPLEDTLRRRADALGVEAIFLGWVDSAPLMRLMQQARAAVVPSLVEEALSRVLLESMSVGTPVISWPVGSSQEVIEHGVNGWLVRQPADFSECLVALRSDETRRRIGAAALETVNERFAPEAVYEAFSTVYAAALEGAEYG